MPLGHSASSVVMTFTACDRLSPGFLIDWLVDLGGGGCSVFSFCSLLLFDLSVALTTCLLLSSMRPQAVRLTLDLETHSWSLVDPTSPSLSVESVESMLSFPVQRARPFSELQLPPLITRFNLWLSPGPPLKYILMNISPAHLQKAENPKSIISSTYLQASSIYLSPVPIVGAVQASLRCGRPFHSPLAAVLKASCRLPVWDLRGDISGERLTSLCPCNSYPWSPRLALLGDDVFTIFLAHPLFSSPSQL